MIVDILSYIVLAAFVIRSVRNTLYHVFLWQNKEYRLDMLRIYLSTKVGRNIIFGFFAKLKFLLLAFFFVSLFFDINILYSITIWSFGVVLVIEGYRNIREFLSVSLPLPKYTPKVLIIIFFALFFQFILVLTSSPRFGLDMMPFLDKLLAVTIAMQVGLFSFPGQIRDSLLEYFTSRKMVKMDNLKVVGITGSYGKSTAKELVYQIVKDDFNVVISPKNVNKPVGISKLILDSVNKLTNLVIIEVAADIHHGRNQIERIANMLVDKLEIAVITGLNQQHMALFKSTKEIAKAKYSLVSNLNDNGVAVLKVDNNDMRMLVKRAKKDGVKTVLYGTDKRLYAYACNINLSKDGSRFKLVLGKKTAIINTKLLGQAGVEGIVVAAVVSEQLGLSWNKIKLGLKKLKSPENSIIVTRRHGSVLIDDTYTANPDGVIAGLDYLSLYDGVKILVLNPLAELGEDSQLVHRNIAKYAKKICNSIVLTNRNDYDVFNDVLRENFNLVVKSKNEVKEYIDSHYKGKKTILFEGKESIGALMAYKS